MFRYPFNKSRCSQFSDSVVVAPHVCILVTGALQNLQPSMLTKMSRDEKFKSTTLSPTGN